MGRWFPYTFRVCFIDPFPGHGRGAICYKDLKAKTAAILYDVGDEYSQFLGKYFVDAFEKPAARSRRTRPSGRASSTSAPSSAKIKYGNPDVVFIPTMQKEAALAAKQARDLGIKAKLMGGDGWAAPISSTWPARPSRLLLRQHRGPGRPLHPGLH